MTINYKEFTDAIIPGIWYTSKELDAIWEVEPRVRRLRVKVLCDNGQLKRKGKTANMQYSLKGKAKASAKEIAMIGTSKRKIKDTTPLDKLITAATDVGSENEILKAALREAAAIIEKALEAVS